MKILGKVAGVIIYIMVALWAVRIFNVFYLQGHVVEGILEIMLAFGLWAIGTKFMRTGDAEHESS